MKRGQASAPIELVVAIIVMAMSMALALSVMSQTSTAQCEDQIKAEMRSLSSALLDVSLGSPPTAREVQVHLQACGSYNVNLLRLVKYTDPKRCAVDCPSATGGCWKIVPVSYDAKTDSYTPILKAVTCIDLPQKASLTVDQSSDSSDCSQNISYDACPPGVKANDTNDYCGAGPEGQEYNSSQSKAQWFTLAKEKGKGETYLVRVSKTLPTQTGEQTISVCFKPAKKP
jgi:type II secretory pathway pseudopilin PulG